MERLGRPSRSGLLAALLCSLLIAPARAQTPPATAAGVGKITGRVLDKNKEPVAYANVSILGGPRLGALTDENGNFNIPAVPVGSWQIQAAPVGFDKQVLTVQVNSGQTASVTFSVAEPKVVKQIEEIEVRAEKRIDTKSSTTKQTITGEKLKELPVDNLREAIGTKAGVVAQNGELHFRGGRGGEVKFQFDGTEVSNPLSGGSANVATLAVAGTDIISGGFDAEYGNALSGVVNVSTREGTDRFGGEVRWDTDRYGDPTKTFDNFDRFTFGFGGPTPVKNLTYFATYEGTFQDTYLRSTLTRPHHTLVDFLQFGNRQNNVVNTNLKFAYRVNSKSKVTFETINNRSIVTPYNHMWSRKGYVQYITRQDPNTREVTHQYGSWSFTPLDSTYIPMNMPDHIPTTDDRFQSFATVWTNQISDKSVLTARLASIRFDQRTSVGRKQPWEYDTQSPFFWSGNTQPGTENNLYYATHGDYPNYNINSGSTEVLKSDFSTRRWKNHTVKTGVEAKYNRVQNLGLNGPNLESFGLPGQSRSDFINYNPEGAAYVQDRWEYEGLVLNAGARFDLFSPGLQISDLDLRSGKRYKQQVSPRLGIAYPISDKDQLSFHYGWTYQTPSRNVVFQNRGINSSVNTRGNPDLQPETNISYQAGMQHLFSRDVSGQFTVFFKDIYGLLTVRQKPGPDGLPQNVWTNGDYASARGFEATVSKSFSHKFSAEVDYSYQIATGVASNPNAAVAFFNGGQLYLPISEQPLDWDQRSTLSLSFVVRDLPKWGFRVLWSYGSGFPFTPTFRNDRKPDPLLTNSRYLPSTSRLTFDGDKFYKVWGQSVTVFFDARNVLNATTIGSLVQNSFPNTNVDRTGGSDYLIYYTETGRAGGAYLQDINGDNLDDWVPVRDPRVFAEGRNVRLGVRVTF